jgi:predicted nucleotidyltransferase component of viral defense system
LEDYRVIYGTGAAFRQALETRLRERSFKTSLPLLRLRKSVAFDRLLARIAKQSGKRWVLKGGLALEWQFGERARTTMDIDASVLEQMPPRRVLDELRKAASLNLSDWFEFEVGEPSPSATGAPFGGYRFSVRCLLDGRDFERFSVDVGMGDPIIEKPRLIKGPDLLRFAGVTPSKVRCYPLSSQIAEKLHAYTRPHEGRESSRVKDFVDILLIASFVPFRSQALRKAIHATFQTRASHKAPPSLPPPPAAWALPYSRMARELRLSWSTLESAAGSLTAFLDPVLQQSAHGTWHPSEWKWR